MYTAFVLVYMDMCIYQISKFITAATEGTKIAATSAAESLNLLESFMNMVCTSCVFYTLQVLKVDQVTYFR